MAIYFSIAYFSSMTRDNFNPTNSSSGHVGWAQGREARDWRELYLPEFSYLMKTR